MEKVDTLIVDKTGTLTEGKPSVTGIVPADGFDEQNILRLAAGVERASEHPLALAIVAAAEARGITIPDVTTFDLPTGKGALGTVEGKLIVLGNASFLAEHGVDAKTLAAQADSMRVTAPPRSILALPARQRAFWRSPTRSSRRPSKP